ncbi:MAG TPA: cobyrinate a,c-diamide synthase [Chloroflexota bacterium]|nr:cobyrinate a,c-diamide synthase [Chloroflexota bacterium]
MTRRLVIAGTSSGVGKTTVVCGLISAYRQRGLHVQPFKAGPDYIDPSHHTAAAGVPSRTLDSVLVPHMNLRAIYKRAARSADIAIVEGVMGLFDGRGGQGEAGSTAQIAKLIDAPVVVVIDAAKTSRTAGALALGCVAFDPDLKVAGFILNRVGSADHARWAADSIQQATGLPVLGAFPRDPDLSIPERHLGLVPAAEASPAPAFFDRLAAATARAVDLDRVWSIADAPEPAPAAANSARLYPDEPLAPRTAIAVARDLAFSFYYEDALDLLAAWGAEVIPFSPLWDDRVPTAARGVYLGGGFPELYAAQLAANSPMVASVRDVAARGLPIYGECGGLMYLGRSLVDLDGRTHPMAGIVPLDSAMQWRRAVLGYRTVTALRPSPLLPVGAEVTGHEFHYSVLGAPAPPERAAYRIAERGGGLEGYAVDNVLASYVHVHFAHDAAIARRFVERCVAVDAPV